MKQQRIGPGIAFGVALGVAAPGLAQQAVQWRVEDGGNGHWYQLAITIDEPSWQECQSRAVAVGGYLATATSAAENNWLASLALGYPQAWTIAGGHGPALGGYQGDPMAPAQSGWSWVSGEPWSFQAWATSEPNDFGCVPVGARESFLAFRSNAAAWNDIENEPDCWVWLIPSYLIEWSADCNADGIVDYGQILDGTFEDADSNGVPDICEVDPCPGDVVESGEVNGIDLAAILAYWGTDGGKFPRTDANGDGTVDANDLAIVLSGWGNCP